MIAVDVHFHEDATPPVAPDAAPAAFVHAAREPAGTLAGVGDWPSLAALGSADVECVRDRFVCAAAFVRYALAELEIVRETLGRVVASAVVPPAPQAKGGAR